MTVTQWHDVYATVTEAAALLDPPVTRQYIGRLIREGRLDAFRIGRMFAVRRADVLALNRKRGPKPKQP